ncbi:G-box binding factor, partial [Haplosporangium bisporale]
YEAVPESLKNCLLVMSTSEAFSEASASRPDSLWNVTWVRINKFLPNLKAEIFPEQSEGGSSYAALMMGVSKTLFSVSNTPSPAPAPATATAPPPVSEESSVQVSSAEPEESPVVMGESTPEQPTAVNDDAALLL